MYMYAYILCKFEVSITKHQSVQLNFNSHPCKFWQAWRWLQADQNMYLNVDNILTD